MPWCGEVQCGVVEWVTDRPELERRMLVGCLQPARRPGEGGWIDGKGYAMLAGLGDVMCYIPIPLPQTRPFTLQCADFWPVV